MTYGAALLVSALAGFVGLAFEVLWFRALSYVTGSAPWVFGALLGAYLLGVAASSFAVHALCRRRPAPRDGDVQLLAAFIGIASAAAYLVVPALAAAATHSHWAAALPLLAAAAGLLGAVLPLVAHFAIPAGDEAGRSLSIVYLADILGSAAGSALTGYVLLDRLTTQQVSILLAGAGFALATLVAGGRSWRGALRVASVAALATAGSAAAAPRLFDRLWERLQLKADDDGSRFACVVENRHGIVAVDAAGVVYGGGAYDGAVSVDPIEDRNGIHRAWAVGALHPRPARVLMIGLGSGSWAQVLANLPGVERLTVIDINPGYLEIVRKHAEVASLLLNPRVEVVLDDARRWLARHPDRRFDVVVSNVMIHWRANSTVLLSTEFAALVKSRMAPGGLYALNTTFFVPVRDTTLAHFSHGAMIGTFLYASDAPIAMDPDAYRLLLREVRIGGRPVVDPRSAAVADVPRPRPVSRDPRAPVITDDNLLPEYHGIPFNFRPPRLTGERP